MPKHWIEIPSLDPERSCEFYREAFGWKITREDAWPDYPLWEDEARGLQGAFEKKYRPMTEAGILINLTVDSIERELQAVERAGGQVVQRRQLIAGDVGWWAHFRDPSGNLLALFEPAQKAE